MADDVMSDVSWDIGLASGEEPLFEVAVVPPFPVLHLSTGWIMLGNAVNSHYFSCQDKKTK
jgi:hypothetical protein